MTTQQGPAPVDAELAREVRRVNEPHLQPSHEALRSDGWREIERAPEDTWVIVRTEFDRVFKARLVYGFESEEGGCWGWTVDGGDTHPDCWSDGVCWKSNADDEPSDKPVGWMPLPDPPVLLEGGGSSRSQPCGVAPSELTDPQSQHPDGES